ncbi:OLC1v1037902C1 [Oldenlandia corymbosa var. corymbosa]|uniref:OLC1v1037902C1 n=1 Tax=Oldenlandia corymbosa var. corymbosa TaxID=529605 RepID=A0AAV1D1N7_OLDCO|nr:OLC1v1037902C1 [Oldenlandia corymbosa var. corymbosa]
MAGSVGGTAAKVPSLPPPRPKSPPEYPDLYGKRRELAKVQMLEREIGFLEDELKFVSGLQPASKSCREVTEFVTANSDPLTPTTKRVRKSCWLWRWLCGSSCLGFSSTCCDGCCCIPKLRTPRCCTCNPCECISCSCISCTKPDCRSCSCGECQCCCRMPSCSSSCCSTPKCPSCSNCCCNSCTSCVPKCPKINLCSCCTKTCFTNCCNICY